MDGNRSHRPDSGPSTGSLHDRDDAVAFDSEEWERIEIDAPGTGGDPARGGTGEGRVGDGAGEEPAGGEGGDAPAGDDGGSAPARPSRSVSLVGRRVRIRPGTGNKLRYVAGAVAAVLVCAALAVGWDSPALPPERWAYYIEYVLVGLIGVGAMALWPGRSEKPDGAS